MECHSELEETLGNNALSYRTVVWWVGKFQQGHVSTSNEQRLGRPVIVQTARVVIEQLMDQDRRWTLLELERASGIEKCTVLRILRNDLHIRKVAQWAATPILGIGRIGAPPYSPDISPYDFDLIPKIKEPICGRRFATQEDIANSVCQHVSQFTHGVANAEADDIQHLLYRWQHVVTVAGDYIEGL
ncbi:uncharacterized protein TNCV_759051 [Trichonephila clavipes]|nr:uncharacterized protein TNCV_759051 [Trichonephila clavipes]